MMSAMPQLRHASQSRNFLNAIKELHTAVNGILRSLVNFIHNIIIVSTLSFLFDIPFLISKASLSSYNVKNLVAYRYGLETIY